MSSARAGGGGQAHPIPVPIPANLVSAPGEWLSGKAEGLCSSQLSTPHLSAGGITRRTWPRLSTIPWEEESLCRSGGRSRSGGFHRTARLGSWRGRARQSQGRSETLTIILCPQCGVMLHPQDLGGTPKGQRLGGRGSYMYSETGALEMVCAGGCRLLWLPRLLL